MRRPLASNTQIWAVLSRSSCKKPCALAGQQAGGSPATIVRDCPDGGTRRGLKAGLGGLGAASVCHATGVLVLDPVELGGPKVQRAVRLISRIRNSQCALDGGWLPDPQAYRGRRSQLRMPTWCTPCAAGCCAPSRLGNTQRYSSCLDRGKGKHARGLFPPGASAHGDSVPAQRGVSARRDRLRVAARASRSTHAAIV